MVERGDDEVRIQATQEHMYPHSPDVIERETVDNGFSKGWGMHFLPREKYWLDVHTHYWLSKNDDIKGLVKKYHGMVRQYNVQRMVVMPPIPFIEGLGELQYSSYDVEELNPHLTKADNDDPNLAWMIYLLHTTPDAEFIEKAFHSGACCVKLHNAPLIMDGSDRRVWLSEAWDKAFSTIQQCGIPVLWHVTQRVSDSPYTGGGRNSYWSIGWKKGVNYTNEDLLQDFLQVVERYPGINFIGAHQIHMGLGRLCELFDRYNNLYTDLSCVGYVREDDWMYESDIQYIRDIFMKYSDRILFGTDIIMHKNNVNESYVRDVYKNHIRFIKQLRLPYDVLQKISHENAERLIKF